MKPTVLFIIFFFCFAIISNGQRYRVIADTVYKFDKNKLAFIANSVTHYSYLPGSDRGSTYRSDTVYYDTMYEYISDDTGFVLDYYYTRTYHTNNKIKTESIYHTKKDGTVKLTRRDSFVYSKGNLIKEYRHCLYPGCHSSPTYHDYQYNDSLSDWVLADVPEPKKLYHYSLIEYTYKRNQLAEIKKFNTVTLSKNYPSLKRIIKNNREGNVVNFVTYEYDDNGKRTITDKHYFTYKGGKFTGTYAEQYIDSDTAWSRKAIYYSKEGKRISDTAIAKENSEEDTVFSANIYNYNEQGLESESYYRVYDKWNSNTPAEYIWRYSYTSFDYVKEYFLEEVNYYDTQKSVYTTKVKYTYEVY